MCFLCRLVLEVISCQFYRAVLNTHRASWWATLATLWCELQLTPFETFFSQTLFKYFVCHSWSDLWCKHHHVWVLCRTWWWANILVLCHFTNIILSFLNHLIVRLGSLLVIAFDLFLFSLFQLPNKHSVAVLWIECVHVTSSLPLYMHLSATCRVLLWMQPPPHQLRLWPGT